MTSPIPVGDPLAQPQPGRYDSQYADIVARLNKAFTNNPTNDNYAAMPQGQEIFKLLQQAKTYGVDPNQLNQIVNSYVTAVGTGATSALRSGKTSGQAQDDALAGLNTNALSDLLKIPGANYQQKLDTDQQIVQNKALRDEARQKILASLPGLQTELGDQLLKQEHQAYTTMAPQIEQRLNALGLLQSGALPQAQAYYQSQLESSRQNQLANFGLGAHQQLDIDLPLSGVASDIGLQQNQLNNNLNLNMANINRQFQISDMDSAANLQKQLAQQALEQARQAQSANSNNALYGSLIGAGGSILGSAVGGPLGGYLGKSMFSGGQQQQPRTGTVNNGIMGGWQPY